MKRGQAADAALLPDQTFSHHAPMWWGSRLMIFVEAAAFALLAVIYFYIRSNFDAWPPKRTLLPDLGLSSINLLLLALSAAPFWYASHLAHLHEKPRFVGWWLAVGVVLGIAAIVLRGFEFHALHTWFGSNAYGSITWTILGVHLAHLLAGTVESLNISVAMFVGPVEEKHYADTTAIASYWYFIVISWVVLYAIVFLVPHFR